MTRESSMTRPREDGSTLTRTRTLLDLQLLPRWIPPVCRGQRQVRTNLLQTSVPGLPAGEEAEDMSTSSVSREWPNLSRLPWCRMELLPWLPWTPWLCHPPPPWCPAINQRRRVSQIALDLLQCHWCSILTALVVLPYHRLASNSKLEELFESKFSTVMVYPK